LDFSREVLIDNLYSGITGIKKILRLHHDSGATAILFSVFFNDYSPGAIAPVGQASAQVPQSKQVSGSIV
jgi:hypothetical protein